jgi:hypothetical protein
LSTTVDSAALDAEAHRELRSLVAASGLAQCRSASASRRPDHLQYHLTLEEDGRTTDLHLGEDEVPDALRPLLDWLTDRARRRPRGV